MYKYLPLVFFCGRNTLNKSLPIALSILSALFVLLRAMSRVYLRACFLPGTMITGRSVVLNEFGYFKAVLLIGYDCCYCFCKLHMFRLYIYFKYLKV